MTQAAYTPGHGDNAVTFMSRRRAATHAAFARDLFKPGQAILDCGCGPGTITLDIARLVAPGPVTGIDLSDSQCAGAREVAAREKLSVRFQAAQVTALPLGDASVDGVFSHALFEHLPDPRAALAEIGRVLKPGGFVALRSPDWGGFLLHPNTPAVASAITTYRALQTKNGGDTEAGRKLAAHLRAAGFARIRPSASYEIYDDPARIAEYLALQLDKSGAAPAAKMLREWGRNPDALFAQAWGEAVGWKD